jgi:hypothetical protein
MTTRRVYHAGRVTLGEHLLMEILRDYLGMPLGISIHRIETTGVTMGPGIVLTLEGEGLPEVEEGAVVPNITMTMETTHHRRYRARFDT